MRQSDQGCSFRSSGVWGFCPYALEVAVLARDIGWSAAIACGVVVYDGVAVPFILTMQRVDPPPGGTR